MSEANSYLALGDSITAGYGVGRNHSFATLYYATLCSRLPSLRYFNFGTNGLTTEGLAGSFANNLQFRNMVSKAAIVSITIGSNDVLGFGVTVLRGGKVDFTMMLTKMINNLEFIGGQIRMLNPAAVVLASNMYTPLLAGSFQHYSSETQVIIEQANLALLHWAGKFCFGLVRVDRVFSGKERYVIGRDLLHPSLYGHQVLASEFSRSWQPSKRWK